MITKCCWSTKSLIKALRAAPDAREIYRFHSERIPLQLQSDQYVLLQYKLAGVEFNHYDVLQGRMSAAKFSLVKVVLSTRR